MALRVTGDDRYPASRRRIRLGTFRPGCVLRVAVSRFHPQSALKRYHCRQPGARDAPRGQVRFEAAARLWRCSEDNGLGAAHLSCGSHRDMVSSGTGVLHAHDLGGRCRIRLASRLHIQWLVPEYAWLCDAGQHDWTVARHSRRCIRPRHCCVYVHVHSRLFVGDTDPGRTRFVALWPHRDATSHLQSGRMESRRR